MGKILTTILVSLFAVLSIQAAEAIKRTISIEQTAQMSFQPDLCVMKIVVETFNNDQNNAYEENNAIMNRVNEAVKLQGIEAHDMKTTGFSIQPKYRRLSNDRSLLDGFIVYHCLEVKIRNFGLITNIIDNSMAAGATRIENLNFTFEDRNKYEDQVREKAMKLARTKASQLATLEGFKLGKALDITEFSPALAARQRPETSIQMGVVNVTAEVNQLDIEPGEINLSYTIYITYELE